MQSPIEMAKVAINEIISALELVSCRLPSDQIQDPVQWQELKQFYGFQATAIIRFADTLEDPEAVKAVCRVVGEIIQMIDLYNETNDHNEIFSQMIRVGAYMKAVVDQYPNVDFSQFKKDGGFETIFNINL